MRDEFQIGPVHHLRQLHQPHQIDGAVDEVAVLVGQTALVEQAPHQMRGRLRRHFEAHGVAQMARRQFALQRDAQIGDFVFVDEQFAVARDAELVAATHHQIRKQLAHETLQQRAQQHEAVRIARQFLRHAHEPRQRARRLHDAHQRLAAERILAFQFDDKVQAFVEHARKRMRGIEADRRQDGQQFVEKVVPRPFGLRFIPCFRAVKINAFLFERREYCVVQHAVLAVHELLRPLDHEVVDVLQRHAVRRERARVIAHLLLQPGHADFEEFVEIAAGDADET